ncbi:hypothetical protein C3L33_15247, partial [Rhododendron williamsianum]
MGAQFVEVALVTFCIGNCFDACFGLVERLIYLMLYFNPATVKMLSNLKVLVIAVLLKIIMKRRFSIIQWEALALLLIGISINQLRSLPEGTTALGLPVATGAYAYTLIFVTVPSMASVFNEYALKSQYDTSIYLQNLFLYGYGAIFNFLAILGTTIVTGPKSFDILEGHSKATMLLILNNAAQGILSSFFFKYADTILKKYSSTVATIFTGIASAALFGHTLTINFLLGISVVFISMHQFFSPLSKVKDEEQTGVLELMDAQNNHKSKDSSSSTWQQEQMRRLHIMQGLMKDSHFFPSEVIKGSRSGLNNEASTFLHADCGRNGRICPPSCRESVLVVLIK